MQYKNKPCEKQNKRYDSANFVKVQPMVKPRINADVHRDKNQTQRRYLENRKRYQPSSDLSDSGNKSIEFFFYVVGHI